ncbi:GIY-YIG nuclease family protein [Paenibacillus sp. M1]|uniref:GIY-YIG nuclease family protein n=1 Tax=Paenibacillus haidiansis TaxID=1574488 RepID=A0ABU7VKD9_9BACL
MREFLRNLPSSPGIYLMKDSLGGIIYVGKSKNLKQRVQSYFYNSKSHSTKVKRMVSQIKDMEYRLTDTEFEAFMLECKLIHELKPVYNKKMKNPLAYSYIVIRNGRGMRRIEIDNNPAGEDGQICFGPYAVSRNTVEKAMQEVRECLRIACNQSITGSPCLNHSLGLCLGMCMGGEAEREFNSILDRFIALFNGSDRGLYEELELQMHAAAERYDFEKAAKFRNCIEHLNILLNKEKVIEFTAANRNIVILEPLGEDTSKLFFVKRNRIIYSQMLDTSSSETDKLVVTVKELVRSQFGNNYGLGFGGEITRDEVDEAGIIYSYLQGSGCKYAIIPEEWLNHGEDTVLVQALDALFGCTAATAELSS